LGSWPKQGGCKVVGQEGDLVVTSHALESAKSVRAWTLTFPRELPCWELESQKDSWIFKARLQRSKPIALKSYLYHWKAIKCRCLKWACIAHLDIWNTSYNQKKGRESNWQFDSRPLKVENRPDSLVYKRHATYHWKALHEGYNFAFDFIAIEGLHRKLCALKITRVPTMRISGLSLGSPGIKSHLDVTPMERRNIYYKGGRWWLPPSSGHGEFCVSELLVARPSTKSVPTMH
jgi:hypothetical protein